MTIKPTNNRILIVPIEDHVSAKFITPTGRKLVDVPDAALPNYAKVAAVADNVTCCDRGDTIILHPNSNLLLVNPYTGHSLVADSSVLAVVEVDEVPALAVVDGKS